MKNHFSTILALALGITVHYAWYQWGLRARAALPASDWFEVRSVSVADFEEGDFTAPVVYDRVIRKPFTGTWVAEVIRVPDNFNACVGSGTNRYEASDEVPAAGVTFSWFIGTNCNLPPAQYTMRVHWDIKPSGYPDKEVSLSSNVFTVRPKGSAPYLSKEQLQQLQ